MHLGHRDTSRFYFPAGFAEKGLLFYTQVRAHLCRPTRRHEGDWGRADPRWPPQVPSLVSSTLDSFSGVWLSVERCIVKGRGSQVCLFCRKVCLCVDCVRYTEFSAERLWLQQAQVGQSDAASAPT